MTDDEPLVKDGNNETYIVELTAYGDSHRRCRIFAADGTFTGAMAVDKDDAKARMSAFQVLSELLGSHIDAGDPSLVEESEDVVSDDDIEGAEAAHLEKQAQAGISDKPAARPKAKKK